jgi:hypothetical protein
MFASLYDVRWQYDVHQLENERDMLQIYLLSYQVQEHHRCNAHLEMPESACRDWDFLFAVCTPSLANILHMAAGPVAK